MSNPISALDGATYQGFALVEEVGLQGMITLRGDLASTKFKKAIKDATGLAVPKQRVVNLTADSALAWMSPDELLAVVPYSDVAGKLAALETGLKGQHHLAVNVSDARAMFRVSGAGAREVVAKLAPVDMSADAFKPGQFRRSRMAQVPAAFWMDDNGALNIICFRSVAEYMFNILKASAEPGSEVGHLA